MRDSDDAVRRPRGLAAGRARPRSSGARRTGLTITALSAGVCLFAAACSGSASPASNAQPGGGKAAAPPRPAWRLRITPGNGASGVRTDASIRVSASHATVSKVTVTSGGTTVFGKLNHARTSWRPDWPLHTGTRYMVTATGTGPNGKAVKQTSSFRTLTPAASYSVSIFEGAGQTYGVGMPIMLTFSQPVTRKYAVEKAMQLKTSKPVAGAWYWDGDQTLVFRPQDYWPQHTQVSFKGHFDGLRIAPHVYGTANLTQDFRIGASLITVASTRTHYMKVFYQGKEIGNWPISTGRQGHDTANGTYLTIEKGNPTRMKGNGYNLLVPYAVRFTWSGNYIHDAYWSVAQQGHVNVSHGCVNVSPAHSRSYYHMAVAGDPVTVVGSPSAGKWDDGWTEWFLTWHQLLRGSATHLAVKAGPDGSKFVKPSTLPGPRTTRLHGSKPFNYVSK
ncbi:MAG: L,D-transpeptidase family protein [Nocardiopsaceae bacterium]|nr:L,D-transpeptidase family protein [Nocardiopsaceae bacterium]